MFHLSPRDKEVEKVIVSGKNNPKFPGYLPLNCLKEMFDSSKTYGLFTTYFDTELYQWAASFYKTRIFEGDRPKYAVVGITKVIEDVEFSQNNHPPYHDMQRFIEQDFVKIHSDTQIPDKFKNYLTARIDIRLASANGDFECFSVSDEKATLQKPAWLQNGGIGYQLQSYAGQLSFTAKATIDGKVQMWLRGLDIRDSADRSKRIPYWIDYTKLIINGKTLFSTMTPVWHDKPYTYGTNTKAGEEIKIQVEWQPHRSDA